MIKLTKEQDDVAYYKNGGHLIVKGVAGSGKTLVGIHRIPYLKEKLCLQPGDNILVVTYTKTLINYLEYLIDKDGLNEFTQKTINSLAYGNVKVDIKNVDSLIHLYSRKKMWASKDYEIKPIFETILEEVRKKSEKVRVLKDYEFMKSEIDWIRECNIRSLEEYQNFDRIGRAQIYRIGKNTEVRELIYEVLTKYQSLLKEKNKIDWSGKNYRILEDPIKENQKYTHIIIDEAQDLSKAKLEFLIKLKKDIPNSSMVFLYDSSQSIYDNSWLGSGRTFKSLGIEARGKTRILTQSFRTTKEIHSAAHNMLMKDPEIKEQEGYIPPDFVNSNGIKPMYSYSKTFEEQINSVVEIIVGLKQQYNYTDKDIMIASRNNKSLYKISTELKKRNINNGIIQTDKNCKYDFYQEQISLVTIHSMKGLESKVIILLDVNEGVLPQIIDEGTENDEIRKDRKLLYVGMTRASEILYMCSWGKKSRFLDDIDMGYVDKIGNNFDDLKEKYETGITDVVKKDYLEGKGEKERFKIAKKILEDKTNKIIDELKQEKLEMQKKMEDLILENEKNKRSAWKKIDELDDKKEILITEIGEYSDSIISENELKIEKKKSELNDEVKKLAEEKEEINKEKKVLEEKLKRLEEKSNIEADKKLQEEVEELKLKIERKTSEFDKKREKNKSQLEEKLKEIEELKNKIDILETNSQEEAKNTIGNRKYEVIEKQQKEDFPKLSSDSLKTLITLEYDLENRPSNYDLDYSTFYIPLTKIVEKIFRNFLIKITKENIIEKELTFGKIIKGIEKYNKFGSTVWKLEQLNAVKIRNLGAHETSVSREEYLKLREFLIEKKEINNILAISSYYLENADIKEELYGVAESSGNTIKYNRNEFYTHVINNDILALCKDNLGMGTYEFQGRYDNRDGHNYYIIEGYKVV